MFRRGLRLVRRYVKGQPVPFTVSVTGAALFAVAAVATTVVLGRITDEVIVPAFDQGVSTTAAVGAGAVLAGVALLRACSIVLRRYFGAMTARRTQVDLRRSVSDRYLDVPLAYHQRTPTGQLLAHADADIEAATEIIFPLQFTIGVSVLVVFSVASLALIDPVLTLVALVLFPLLALLNRVYTLRVEEPATRVQENVGRVSTIAHESIDGALVVKALGREDQEVERLAVEADRLRSSRIEVGRLRAAFEPAIDAFPNVAIVALLAIGSWQISTGRITTGELVQAMAIFGLLAFPMRVVGYFLESIPRSVVSIERIDRVLAEEPARQPTGAHVDALPPGPLAVAFDQVSFGYPAGDGAGPAPRVLERLSFDVAPGEIVALVGATGAGKSTITQLVARLIEPDGGVIRLSGVDLDRVDPGELRRAVGLVFQESFLFADSIRENITMGLEVGDEAVQQAARVARADRFVGHLPAGYDTVVGERGVTLSGGQRQRIALARALVRSPQLLVLDDATSAIDPTVEAAILDGLRSEIDTTALVVAQRVSTILLADRVVYVADGRVVASGPHAELLAHPGYGAIVRAYESGAP